MGWWEPFEVTGVENFCVKIINIYKMNTLSSFDATAKNTKLYKEFLAEREEILKNKWYMSERAGYDVGFEKALLDWNFKYRIDWRKKRSS